MSSQPRVLGKAAQARVAASKAQEVETEPAYSPEPPAKPEQAEEAPSVSVPPQAAAGEGSVETAVVSTDAAGGWLGEQAVARSLPALAVPQRVGGHDQRQAFPVNEEAQESQFPSGPGRPDVPRPQDILHLRKIDRSSLGVTVPDALKLTQRLKRYCLDRDVDVVGDAAAVALDAWLSTQGY